MNTVGTPSGIMQLGEEGSTSVARWEEDDDWGVSAPRPRRGFASTGWDDADDEDDWDVEEDYSEDDEDEDYGEDEEDLNLDDE
jgi:hypothetical protein